MAGLLLFKEFFYGSGRVEQRVLIITGEGYEAELYVKLFCSFIKRINKHPMYANGL